MASATLPAIETRPKRTGVDVGLAFAPFALIFVGFMAIPLGAMFWRAFDSGELQKNITSDMVMHAMRLSAITSTEKRGPFR